MVSVIVPVYNAEKYLEKCIESIRSQTYAYLDIILVNDGSSDSSLDICRRYQQIDSRIRVVSQENQGQIRARIAGLIHAKGQLVGFVDSDDWIEPDMYERLWEALTGHQADIAMAGLVFDYEDPGYPPRRETNRMDRTVYDRQQLKDLFPVLLNDGSFIGRSLQPSRVTKLFKKSLVEQNLELWEERVSVGEDLQMVFAVILFVPFSICTKN